MIPRLPFYDGRDRLLGHTVATGQSAERNPSSALFSQSPDDARRKLSSRMGCTLTAVPDARPTKVTPGRAMNDRAGAVESDAVLRGDGARSGASRRRSSDGQDLLVSQAMMIRLHAYRSAPFRALVSHVQGGGTKTKMLRVDTGWLIAGVHQLVFAFCADRNRSMNDFPNEAVGRFHAPRYTALAHDRDTEEAVLAPLRVPAAMAVPQPAAGGGGLNLGLEPLVDGEASQLHYGTYTMETADA